eukprot:3775648-Pyramimonas_sp.AAC.1
MKLKKGIHGVLRQELVRIGELNSATLAGPVPDEEIGFWMPDAPPDGVAESGFWRDVNGGRLDPK